MGAFVSSCWRIMKSWKAESVHSLYPGAMQTNPKIRLASHVFRQMRVLSLADWSLAHGANYHTTCLLWQWADMLELRVLTGQNWLHLEFLFLSYPTHPMAHWEEPTEKDTDPLGRTSVVGNRLVWHHYHTDYRISHRMKNTKVREPSIIFRLCSVVEKGKKRAKRTLSEPKWKTIQRRRRRAWTLVVRMNGSNNCGTLPIHFEMMSRISAIGWYWVGLGPTYLGFYFHSDPAQQN